MTPSLFTVIRWSHAIDFERIPCPGGHVTRHPRHHESTIADWHELWSACHRGRNFQDEYLPHCYGCAPRLSFPGQSLTMYRTGTKFVLLTSLAEPSANTVLQKVYEAYADAVMKNPFHTPEMPIRSEGFDTKIA